MSVRSKLCLTIKKGNEKSGTKIIQESVKNGNESQLWKLHHIKGTLYII